MEGGNCNRPKQTALITNAGMAVIGDVVPVCTPLDHALRILALHIPLAVYALELCAVHNVFTAFCGDIRITSPFTEIVFYVIAFFTF